MYSGLTERYDLPPAEIAAEAGFVEHHECYISVSDGSGKIDVFLNVDHTAVELYDVAFRRLRLPRREVFAEGVEGKYISPRTDSMAVEQNNRTFRRLKMPRKDFSTEREMNCVSVSANCINVDSAASEPNDHFCRRRSLPPNRAVAEVGGSVLKHMTFFRRTDPTPEVFAAGRNSDYKRSNIWTVLSVCNEPVTGSHALGLSHKLGRCCLWWTVLPSHGIGSEEVTLILLLLLMVGSDDSNVVTLLIQAPSMQSRSGDNMIQPYSWILHGVRTLYGQMAESEFARSYMHQDDRCISMLRQFLSAN